MRLGGVSGAKGAFLDELAITTHRGRAKGEKTLQKATTSEFQFESGTMPSLVGRVQEVVAPLQNHADVPEHFDSDSTSRGDESSQLWKQVSIGGGEGRRLGPTLTGALQHRNIGGGEGRLIEAAGDLSKTLASRRGASELEAPATESKYSLFLDQELLQ